MSSFGMENYVAVYLPMSYSVAGNVYIVRKERISPLTTIRLGTVHEICGKWWCNANDHRYYMMSH